MKVVLTKLVYICAVSIGLCAAASNPIIDALKNEKDLSIISRVVEKQFSTADYDTTASPFTFFAPSDKAIRESNLGKLKDDEIIAILAYHVLDSRQLSTDFKDRVTFYNTMQRNSKYVNLPNGNPQVLGAYKSGKSVRLSDGTFDPNEKPASVIKADILAAKGVIHIIDKVLNLPAKISKILSSNPRFSLIGKELNVTNLLSVLDDAQGLTLFAPSNEAISNYLKSGIDASAGNLIPILQNHILLQDVLYSTNITEDTKTYNTGLNGSTVSAGRSRNGSINIQSGPVFLPNLLTANGVIQGINAVLTPDLSIFRPLNRTETGSGNNSTTNGTAQATPGDKNRPLFNLILSILGINGRNSSNNSSVSGDSVSKGSEVEILTASQNIVVTFGVDAAESSSESESTTEITSSSEAPSSSTEVSSSSAEVSSSSSEVSSSSSEVSSSSSEVSSSSAEVSSSSAEVSSSSTEVSSSSAEVSSSSTEVSSSSSEGSSSLSGAILNFSTESFIVTSTKQVPGLVTETSVVDSSRTTTIVNSLVSTTVELITIVQTLAIGSNFTSTVQSSTVSV
ncbi:hypothetical protein AYI70_g167 [Smittium culicis]|uniref:FAS1 domain-containing protein n=1 Tax=Smittium culicis TaxID=133412 RepID=A0A1R1YHR2_9FUNG|nr:hypothetical protein AYI70_g167 [Smittium culicis]